MTLQSIIPFALTTLVSSFGLPAADIYVDASHPSCGSGLGGAADPVCSINAAISLAAPGDVIRIAPGTYTENLAISFDLALLGSDGASVTVVDGGGLGSVVTIADSVTVTIEGLTLTGGAAPTGAGINSQGDLTLRNSTIHGNAATRGGGIRAYTGSLTVEDSTISGNTAASGGGVSIQFAEASIARTVIEGNTATSSGGGVSTTCSGGYGPSPEFTGTISIVGSAIVGNSALHGAGVAFGGCSLYSWGFSSEMANCTVSGNMATMHGGAILTGGLSSPLLSNTTITNNSAGGDGGGSFDFDYYLGGGPVFRDCVVAGNTASTPEMADVGGTFNYLFGTAASDSLIGIAPVESMLMNGASNNQVGTVLSPVDPLLGPLQDNGGPTRTHALLAGSPAIDAGSTSGEVTDQRGIPRPAGVGLDIGAYEVQIEYCNGDGGDQLGCTNCPCMNNAPAGTVGGCLNSANTPGRLIVTGDLSVSLPAGSTTDLRIALTGAPPSAFCILNSGDAVAPGSPANPCFGLNSGAQATPFDGLRCAIQNTRRHGGRAADANGDVGVTNNPWGGEGGPPVGIANAGSGFVAGQTRYLQAINRDDPLLSCMRGLNTSQAIEVVFTP